MMNEKSTVTIALDEYRELVAKAERIAAVERIISSAYVTPEEIALLLGIKVKEDKQ